MRTIQEIYDEYNIMPTLREHMFRVAAVGEMILDSGDFNADRDQVMTALLLHDMANIIKFDLTVFPQFLEPQGLEYWQNVQDSMRDKYGSDEHAAHIAVAHEVGAGQEVADLVDAIGFHNLCINAESISWAQKICSYADLRVYPHGVVSLDQRLQDGRERYQVSPDQERWDLIDCAKQLEDQIFERCNITPEDITDAAIADYMVKYSEYRL